MRRPNKIYYWQILTTQSCEDGPVDGKLRRETETTTRQNSNEKQEKGLLTVKRSMNDYKAKREFNV